VEPRPAFTRSERLKTAALAAVLAAFNAAITPRLFLLDYTREMGSIEAAYIGLARYIRDHFPHLGWFPLWYGGIPYSDAYPPLLHWIVALTGAVGQCSSGLAYHAVTASVYAIGPATLFWAAWRLGAQRTAAFLAALGYSLISPTCLLVREVRLDSGGWSAPRRLVALVRYGEGPHLFALVLLPVAIGLLHVALEKRKPGYCFGAALALAAVGLTNWLGSFALAVMVLVYLLARWDRSWIRASVIGLWAYAIAMPSLPPSTLATIRANAPRVGGRFEPGVGHSLYAGAILIGLVVLAYGMQNKKWPLPARFGILFFSAIAAVVIPAYWFRFALVPQPSRYHLEMDLSFWLAAALCTPFRLSVARRAASLGILLAVPLAVRDYQVAWKMEQPIEIESTVEYRISRWLAAHLPGSRVFAPGTIGFWMNAFSDTPLLTGGFDNGMRNVLLQEVIFQIYFGDRLETALDWLKAYGCDAVIGGGPQSREVYHPYRSPSKLEALPELWREGGDVIYAVPRLNRSLAHAMHPADLPRVTPPGYDTASLSRYLAALDDPALPPAAFHWTGPSRALVTGDFAPDLILSIQVAWDSGWHARVQGQPRRIWGDPLGQIVVEPRCGGPCTVELVWDGGTETRVASAAFAGAVSGGLLWILLWRKCLVLTKKN
jgi:hypothetical protein